MVLKLLRMRIIVIGHGKREHTAYNRYPLAMVVELSASRKYSQYLSKNYSPY